jgi:heptosyltransferase-2
MKPFEPASILVYSPSWIGDSVMALGALRSLRIHYPSAKLTVLAKPWVEELYQGCEAVDGSFRFDVKGAHAGPRGFVRLARALNRWRFDLAVLFPNAFRAAAVARAAGIPERWGYGTDGRSWLLTRSVPPAPRPFGRHQAHYYLDLIRALGIRPGPPNIGLATTPSMGEQAIKLLRTSGWHLGEPLVGLHPGATNSSAKRWVPERYAAVGDRLADGLGARVVLLGGPNEVALAEEIRSLMQKPTLFLAGETSLGELMGVLESLAILVTNDSGPMHLASALGVPTVAIFGPTDERETGPLGRNARVVRQQVECSPCLHRECPTDHRCMSRVQVDEICQVAMELLEGQRAPRAAAEAAWR